ncbi:hypothetical protein SC1083_0768 [Aggregatibacter actinomycetemcomitans serotype e str. SC1083]|uniref:Uncharacterized protein n=1 Tax=Aggregatibacter actinomycetemcomitans serotype e str. SC1083 TaxID=907488 RepID=G4A7H2_AGGAC|nr:hypothetical protein SC1083_0768 [Aggregatibacter actinomycetemcomitans serotype e str. SC1083]KYK72580.1 hypothetical protein SA3096_09800 [Aggregatibacter actinomycetemcomitans serotype e str. SA3096]KYK78664.1 hypothetical protein SC936_08875 [Aggregatibacter actinomycetemcomitans serotype e str. SC936]KYK92273.1 hypothetical protein ANH9776_09545 [Aggregatibacter actinomycetemcomitans serotype e str. ANH9776]TYB22188.1 hypothetical protein FXB85_08475 [Aggregatibacter actinomycetemcomita
MRIVTSGSLSAMIFSKAIDSYRNEGPKSAVGKNIIFFDRTFYWLMLSYAMMCTEFNSPET